MTDKTLTYLKTWSERTRSDAVAAKTTPVLIDDVLNNLNELDKFLATITPAKKYGRADNE